MNWEEYKVGEIGKFKYGKGLSELERSESGNPVFSSAGIVGYHSEVLASKGIIIGRKGNAGSVCFSEVPFFPIDTTFFIDEVADGHDLKYFFYLLGTVHLENFAADAAVPGLNREVGEILKIKLPPLPVQRRIAEILGRYDALIENYTAQIRRLETAAQDEEKRAAAGGLSEEKLEIFDMLFVENLGEADTKKVKDAAQDLLQKLKASETQRTILTSDWYKRPQLRQNVNELIGKILDQSLPEAYDEITFKKKWKSVYTYVYNVASRGKAYWQ